MKHLTCSYRGFERDARLTYFAGPNGPAEAPEAPKTPELPDEKDITREHVQQVMRAIDYNVHEIESYYKSSVATTKEMPEDLKKQVDALKTLKTKLEQAQFNPARARAVFLEVYKIFNSIEEGKQKTIKEGQGDPLLGFLYNISMPTLTVTPKAAPEKKLTWKEKQEAKERENAKLFRDAVENMVRGQGELTQAMLDQVKSQLSRVGGRPLVCSITIEGNPVRVFLRGAADGFQITAFTENKSMPKEGEAPARWTKANFTDAYSYVAENTTKPVFADPEASQKAYVQAMGKPNFKVDKDLA